MREAVRSVRWRLDAAGPQATDTNAGSSSALSRTPSQSRCSSSSSRGGENATENTVRSAPQPIEHVGHREPPRVTAKRTFLS